MKSAFCAICSSVMPIWTSSSKIGLHVGSARSIPPLLCGLLPPIPVGTELYIGCGAGICCGCGGGGFELFRLRPNSPPSRPWLLCPPPLTCAYCAPPAVEPKGVVFVALLAFFSRSSIFFLNCLASFSSRNESAAMHCSSSNE